MSSSDMLVSSLADPSMQWFHPPTNDGHFRMDGEKMILVPPAQKDYWRRTYYEPLLIKDDGPFLYKELDYPFANQPVDPISHYYTVETAFDLVATAQFDQAGIMIRLGKSHWIKTGIEVVDGVPRLSCVVTNNDYSDWSTQAYASKGSDNASAATNDPSPVLVENVQLRVHCRGQSFVVEAMLDNEWQFIRIAHVDVCTNKVFLGVFACCPTAQTGGTATFKSLSIKRGSDFDHHA